MKKWYLHRLVMKWYLPTLVVLCLVYSVLLFATSPEMNMLWSSLFFVLLAYLVGYKNGKESS